MKICKRCKESKPFSAFYKRTANKDGLTSSCKACENQRIKAWKDKSPEYKARHAKRKQERLDHIRLQYVNYMMGKKCIDCGYEDIRALVWDHVKGDKKGGVLQLVNNGHPWSVVLEEIEKCELRCHNCHTIVTGERAGYWLDRPVRLIFQ